jgi:hypothetical protein
VPGASGQFAGGVSEAGGMVTVAWGGGVKRLSDDFVPANVDVTSNTPMIMKIFFIFFS